MKVLRVNFNIFRNEEWFQFFTEFKDLAEKHLPEKLEIAPLFPAFVEQYNRADEALELILKSAETERMNAADHKRDHTYRGLKGMVKAFSAHYDEAKQLVAHELLIPLDHYGDLASKAPDEETAGLYNFIQDMRGKYALLIDKLELKGWIDELERDNIAYGELARIRNIEITSRTKFRMLQVRKDAQEIYRAMIERMEASQILKTNPSISSFINEWNGFIKRRKDIAAQRKGSHQSKTASEGSAEGGEVENS